MKLLKNKFIKIISVLLAAAFTTFGMTACGSKTTVTFNYNYEGAPEAEVVEIEKGEVTEEPEAPERERYVFKGWYTDASGTAAFDFEEAIYDSVTVYAKWEMTHALVKFDNNYAGSGETETQSVKLGENAIQPDAPERDGYIFTGWYTDSACGGESYEFSEPVVNDLTLYAGWEEDTGDNVTITYMWNYDGAPDDGVASTVKIKANSKTKSYAAVRDGYYLAAWYTDAQCTVKFDFNKRVTASTTLYAKWFDIFTFEAEYVSYEGMIGNGYSGNQSGVGLIVKQKAENQQASNGHYAGWMYREGNTLEFNIHSDRAVTDAVVVLRLSAEFYNMTLTSDKYLVQVNGTNLSYQDIALTGVPEQGTNNWRPFSNHTISKTVNLKEGDNTIKLIVNNADRLGDSGTMYATAPLTDCLYVYTDAELTWEPLTGNLNGNIS